MARKLKVWGWVGINPNPTNGHRQVREVVATTTKRQAIEASGLSAYTFNQYAGETGNTTERVTALSDPGAVFYRPLNDYDAEWTKR